MRTGNFTPIDTVTGKRIKMRIDPSINIPRGRDWTLKVTDLDTGIKYLAQGAPCSLPDCFCDAVVTRLKSKRER